MLHHYSDQELEGAADVQNRLDTSWDHSDGSPAELHQVCADVQTCRKKHDYQQELTAMTVLLFVHMENIH